MHKGSCKITGTFQFAFFFLCFFFFFFFFFFVCLFVVVFSCVQKQYLDEQR